MGLFHWRTRRQHKPGPEAGYAVGTPQTAISQAYYDSAGRRRRRDIPYLLPKDTEETRRLDYQQYVFRAILHGNCFAPVDTLLKNGCLVLDVGCGTGRWGCEIARQYPASQVIGLDIEELSTGPKPANYTFQQGNVLNPHGLPFRSGHFQYVHQRLLGAALPVQEWPRVVQELKRVTHLDGWVELVEMGNTFHQAGPATAQILAWWNALCATRGIDTSNLSLIGTLLRSAGFASVIATTHLVPLGSWGGRVGTLLAQDMLCGWPSMRPSLETALGVSPAHFDAVLRDLEPEWKTHHTHYEIYCACGQQPDMDAF